MRLDLSADPWGVAMLGTAVVVVLGIAIGLLALAMRTSKRAAGWFCGLGSVAFLATAAGGTVQRVAAHDADARKQAAQADKPEGKVLQAPPVPVDGEPAAVGAGSDDGAADGGDAADGADAAGESGEAEGDPIDGGTAAAIADPVGMPPGEDPPEAAEPAVSPVPPPLPDFPSDPAAAKAEAEARLRDAKKVVAADETCRDPMKLQSTWQALSTIPPTLLRSRVKSMARDVEGCRRRLVGGRQWKLRKDKVAARDDFAPEELKKRLAGEGIAIWTNVHGKDHEKLNAGSKALTKAKIEALLEGGLREELKSLGFQSAAFSYGDDLVREDLAPKSVDELVDEELAPYGLDSALSLD